MESHFLTGVLSLIALQHLGFMVLEIAFWQKPLGRKIFGLSVEAARTSAKLAANQGVYNGFLAVGLAWAVVDQRLDVALFFSSCVFVAGFFAAVTVNKRIFLVQSVPALVALATIYCL